MLEFELRDPNLVLVMGKFVIFKNNLNEFCDVYTMVPTTKGCWFHPRPT
jgi:hypothetical protein